MQTGVVGRNVDLEAVVAGQGLGDDLLLDLAVERQEQLLAGVVLTKVDERVLFSEVGERLEHGVLVLPVPCHDRRLERRRRKHVVVDDPLGPAEAGADACAAESVDLGDVASASPRATPCRAVFEDLDGRDGVGL